MFSSSKMAVAAFLLLALTSTAVAQQRIYGVVRNADTHAPLAAAHVKIESNLLSVARDQVTDDEGHFSFAALSPGSYTLTASLEGFYLEHQVFLLAPRTAQQVEFELSPQSRIQEKVVVSAGPALVEPPIASTGTTVMREQIEALPSGRRAQLTDIVTPFVSSAVAGHDNLVHLRGNELSLNTFINGVSFFDNPHQLFTPGLSPDIIQSVKVITGGFPAEFGNRFGGILDIVTRSGFDSDNHGSLTLGMGNALRNNLAYDFGGHTDRLGYFLYVQAFESERFLNTPEPKPFHDFGKGARSFLQLDYRYTGRDYFKLSLISGGTNFELPNRASEESHGRDFFQRNREQAAIFTWDHFFSGSSALSTSAYERWVGSRLQPTSDPLSIQAGGLRNDVTVGVKSDYSLMVGSNHIVKTGIDVMMLRLREDFAVDPRGNEIEVGRFRFRGRNTGGQAGIYFQDEVKLTRSLTANLGLRYDQYSLVTSGHALSPRINLAYAFPSAYTVVHFAYNRFFSPPPIENLLLSARLGFERNPPGISRSNHFEVGASRTLLNRLVLNLTGYWRSDKNSFENTELGDVRVFAPTTFAKGKAYGIEFSGRLKEIESLGLSGYFGYTGQRAFQTGPVSGGFSVEEIGAGERNPTAFDQIHTLVGGLTWREHRSGFWASTRFEYGSGTPAELPTSDGEGARVRLPGHLLVNFSLGLDLSRKETRGLSLQVNFENLTDRVFRIAKESEFTPVQYSPPRFISGSLKLRF